MALFVGGVPAHLPTVVSALLLLLAVTGAAVLSAVTPRGQVVLALGVPLVAAGVSYDDIAKSAGAAALLVVLALRASPPDAVYAVLCVGLLASAAATCSSRWYISSAFTTFSVFLLLLFDHPEQTAQKFDERVVETILGVALAYLFGWLVPALTGRGRQA